LSRKADASKIENVYAGKCAGVVGKNYIRRERFCRYVGGD
jgi:hypothetical protein